MSSDIRSTLDRLIRERGASYASISALIGRNPAYIQQFIARGTPRKLDESDRQILARYFGVEEAMLGALSPFAFAPKHPQSPSAIVAVPRLALGASAGQGSLDEHERAAGALAFDAGWLRGLGVKPQRVSIILVDGESMAPTLCNCDEIMVDHDDDAGRLRDGIYVLRLDGLLMVKRVAWGPRRGLLSVLSDNPHYPNRAEIDSALVTIIGRVVWVARKMA